MTDKTDSKSADLLAGETLLASFKRHIALTLGKDPFSTREQDAYEALAYAVRDRLIDRWIATQQQYYLQDTKRVYYLSMEFLVGRTLGNAALNLDLRDEMREAIKAIGYELEDVEAHEPDAGLGNGGLGRLAACFLDSLASLQYPAFGYGLRYDFGIFHQQIKDGFQVEEPDNWLRQGNPWEICRHDCTMTVGFGGVVETIHRPGGGVSFQWVPGEEVLAVPYDTPIPGYRNNTVNTLRLWSARASQTEFDLDHFNEGAYVKAIEERALAENITKILYPNDQVAQGRELRLRQQHFMASATLQDILRRYFKYHDDLDQFADKVAIQLNDTHPAIAIPELMRLLIDQYQFGWDAAWAITERCFAYTNHTLLEEALEKWSVRLMTRLLPRHMQIIREIDQRFLRRVASKFPGDLERLDRMSLIVQMGEPMVRMAYMAIVASHSVNGVAKLHTELLKSHLMRDFYEVYPERFNSKTNGITPRRWILHANPELTELITSRIGSAWQQDLAQLVELRAHADDPELQRLWREIKLQKKAALAKVVKKDLGLELNLDAIFDVQIKRIHEYKRQLLNILYVIAIYLRLKEGGAEDFTPRAVLFAGKAAPGYFMAKLIIKLINAVADVINNDPDVAGRLQVAFLPDYRVSYAEVIIPASEVSQQISTAGKEASGTGNMKLALNGAITIGTLDGANIEMLEDIGEESMFIFGLRVEEIEAWQETGYDPVGVVNQDPELARVLNLIRIGHFCIEEPGLFQPLLDSLLSEDPFMVLADFRAYFEAQHRLGMAYKDVDRWTRMSILNVAGIGYFSSDRTIREYATEIWGLEPCPIEGKKLDWGDKLPAHARGVSGL